MGNIRILNSPFFVALIAGILAITGINNISRLLGIWGSDGIYIVALFVFLIMGMALAYFAPQTRSKIVLIFCAYVGIVLGVTIDATLDFFLRHYDRNLFPFEIVLWWIIAPLPLLVGVIAVQRTRDKSIKTNKDNE
jgi:hypothetical protein